MNVVDLTGILRAMAWERAKGELQSMRETYVDNQGRDVGHSPRTQRDDPPSRFDEFSELTHKYITAVQGLGLHQ